MDKENQFQDAENFTADFSKDQLTFKIIVLQHLKKIGEYASVELRGGFWEVRPNPNPQINSETKIYIPDTREVYSNAVEYFFDILFPHFDKEMKKAGEEAERSLKEVFEKTTVFVEKDREDTTAEEGEEQDRIFDKVENRVFYRTERVKVNRKLFRDLCSFLYRRKYLELGKIED
jgi:hypothetical protein